MSTPDFNDLDSRGVPLDATPDQMREFIDGAVRNRREMNLRLTKVEAATEDIKDGQQVLYAGHRRLEGQLREALDQLGKNTAMTVDAAETAKRTEANTKEVADAFKTAQIVVKAVGPVSRFVTGTTKLLVQLGLIGGVGISGWRIVTEWAAPLAKTIFKVKQ